MQKFRKAALWAGGIVVVALLTVWAQHFLGPQGKLPSCFSADSFWGCVADRMRGAGHL